MYELRNNTQKDEASKGLPLPLGSLQSLIDLEKDEVSNSKNDHSVLITNESQIQKLIDSQ